MKKYRLSLTCASLLLLSFNTTINSDYTHEPIPLVAYQKTPSYKALFNAASFLGLAGLSLYFSLNPVNDIHSEEDTLLMALSTLVLGTMGVGVTAIEYTAYCHKDEPILTINKDGITYIKGIILRNPIFIPWNSIKSITCYETLQGILINSSLHGNILLGTSNLNVSQEDIYQKIQHFIIAHQRNNQK